MIEQINKVEEFHKSFGVHIGKVPTIPEANIAILRDRLIQEETKEVSHELQSSDSINLDKIAKELCDLLYVTYGTIISYGLQNKIEECFDEVHRSNMSKLQNGKPVYREDGKVMKGKDYSPANIEDILFSPEDDR